MKYLKKSWFRVLISLLVGGAITEFIHISTGEPNRAMTSNPTLIWAVIVYLILTFIVKQQHNN